MWLTNYLIVAHFYSQHNIKLKGPFKSLFEFVEPESVIYYSNIYYIFIYLALIEQQIFNALALTTHNWVLWGMLASYVGVICLRMGALLMEAWGDVTFRYRVNGVLQHNTLHHALYERAGAEPLPVSALEAINRLRDDVGEVDIRSWPSV